MFKLYIQLYTHRKFILFQAKKETEFDFLSQTAKKRY